MCNKWGLDDAYVYLCLSKKEKTGRVCCEAIVWRAL